jgi:hypothetical protein
MIPAKLKMASNALLEFQINATKYAGTVITTANTSAMMETALTAMVAQIVW